MRRKTRDFGRLKLVAAFLFISVFVPNIINAINSSATDNLGQFEAGETGIKLCATIDDGLEDSLRFSVSNDQGFASDVIVDKDTCRTIKTEAATYTIRQYISQVSIQLFITIPILRRNTSTALALLLLRLLVKAARVAAAKIHVNLISFIVTLNVLLVSTMSSIATSITMQRLLWLIRPRWVSIR